MEEEEPAGNWWRNKSRQATGGGIRAGGLSLISSFFLCTSF